MAAYPYLHVRVVTPMGYTPSVFVSLSMSIQILIDSQSPENPAKNKFLGRFNLF